MEIEPEAQIAQQTSSSTSPGRAELVKALFCQGRDTAARRDPPVDVSTPVPHATRGAHANDEPKQRQPERDVPGCRDENATDPSVAFRDREQTSNSGQPAGPQRTGNLCKHLLHTTWATH
ncbi:hypothetical protein Taro_044753 [Colocasia esculenta]|uniref:Uncharacterized protein n=1 Tax=Colocasia esculenta TaxID=4460 RepID=A0A843WMP6_COLES|nr:hypothetical protein [Colocasia esculenta]